ncbi:MULTISPECIES: TetR/AcrR family transcriptional regulator [Pseudomonadota]|jgi:AcrR family transcriptional regulator|uniref:TetR/AcrR family transcriptional regulator n=1 Tax=Pseudomonadota TaxID=1224 RepID=UPI001B69DF89|nr:TetR/AcrR family transcriptional regulator [Achromobacter xylosoxidans]MBP7654968.1 TetR/AcrR family transcriptional regulator [Pseudoxanthomonas sp.]MCH4578144.1 TetR/AcrR family transcriptional regulator [Achromobacter xylosoxidans]
MTERTPTDPRQDGRRLRGDRSRGPILAASIHMASEEGLESLTFGRVGSAAGVGKSNIQVLFGSREQLQLATLDEAMARYRARVVEPAMAGPTPLAQLTALIDNWYCFVDHHELPGGCFLNAVSSEYRCRPGPIRERIERYRQAKRARFRELIARAQDAGELGGDLDVDDLVFRWVACEAVANVAALMRDEEEFARARATALAPLREGESPATRTRAPTRRR